jgi:uncharacterized protein
MRELAALQARFGAGLEVAGPEAGVPDIFTGESGQVASRFGIYRGNARANASRALAAAYPVVAKIVGGEFFSGLAREYESRFPSVSGDLNEYGESFAAFLAVFAPAQDIPYLADVARLDWQVHRAHYAADAKRFEPARLSSVPAEKQLHLIPQLHPACSLIHSEFPLARIWEIHQETHRGEFEVDFSRGPAYVLVYRPRFRVEVGQVGGAEAAFLAAALGGETIEAALTAAHSHDVSFDLGRSLGEWIGSSVIVDFALNGE